jgi:hypothetical protein
MKKKKKKKNPTNSAARRNLYRLAAPHKSRPIWRFVFSFSWFSPFTRRRFDGHIKMRVPLGEWSILVNIYLLFSMQLRQLM